MNSRLPWASILPDKNKQIKSTTACASCDDRGYSESPVRVVDGGEAEAGGAREDSGVSKHPQRDLEGKLWAWRAWEELSSWHKQTHRPQGEWPICQRAQKTRGWRGRPGARTAAEHGGTSVEGSYVRSLCPVEIFGSYSEQDGGHNVSNAL